MHKISWGSVHAEGEGENHCEDEADELWLQDNVRDEWLKERMRGIVKYVNEVRADDEMHKKGYWYRSVFKSIQMKRNK